MSDMTDDEILERAKEIEKRRSDKRHQKADAVENRADALWNGDGAVEKFGLDELRFSAGARCTCGLGLAYPKDCGGFHYWSCSGVLLGTADKAVKHDQLPFMFYSVKSEDQPSAGGRTTRPEAQR